MRAVGAEQRRNIGLAELWCQPLAAQQALAGARQPLGLIEPAADRVVLRQLIATAQQRRAGAGQRAQQQAATRQLDFHDGVSSLSIA